MSRSPFSVVRDYLALAGGEMVAKLAGVLAFAYLARTLTPASYGAVELAAALAMFFALVVDFGLGPIGSREVARQPERAAPLAAVIPTARLGLAVLAAAGMLLCAVLLDQPAPTRSLIAIYAASLLGLPWTLDWLFQGLGQVGRVALANATRMAVFATLVVLLVARSSDLWKVGVIETAAVSAMAAYYLLSQRAQVGPARLAFDRPELGRLLREALPVGLSRVVWAFNQYLPTVLVAVLVGGVEIAWFGAAHRITTSLGAFAYLYHFNLYPHVARTVGAPAEELAALLRSSFRLTAWAGILAGLAGTLLAEPLCVLVFGDPFRAAAPALALLIWTLPLMLWASHARFALIAYDHSGATLIAHSSGAVCTVILASAWIGRWGAMGTAAAMIGSQLVNWAVAQALARRYVGRVPFLKPLLRPALTALVAAAVAQAVPGVNPWWTGMVGLGIFGLAAPLVEPALVRDVKALLQHRATAPADSPDSGARDRRGP